MTGKRSHVDARPLEANPLPVTPPEPAPHEPNALTLKTPKVERPIETEGGTTRFALGTDRPD